MRLLLPALAFSAFFALPLHAQFAPPVDLSNPRGGFREAEVADLDGDGDLDVVAVSDDFFNDPTILWYANDGSGMFGTSNPIVDFSASDIEVADMDGNGTPDIVFAVAGENRIGYIPNLGSGVFGTTVTVSDTLSNVRKATPFDLDGDGDLDLLTLIDEPGIFDTQSGAAWYENDGSGSFTPHLIFYGAIDDPFDIEAGDLDGDGDVDLVLACLNGDKLQWFRNQGGLVFSSNMVIPSTLVGCRDVELADLDGDSDLDIAVCGVGNNRIAWMRNNGAAASFTQNQLSLVNSSVDDALDIDLLDMDNDGDLDIAAALLDENAVDVVENLGSGNFAAPVRLSGPAFGGYTVAAGDLDNDGFQDLVSGSINDAKLAWYKNLGGTGFGEDQTISTAASGVSGLHAADLDGDGDLDVLQTTSLNPALAWYENLNGVFAQPQVIDQSLVRPTAVKAADLDNNGTQDLVVIGDSTVRIYNNNGAAVFTVTDLAGLHDDCRGLAVEDLTGNGLPDIIVTSWFDSRLSWYQNLGGGNFGPQQVLATIGGADGLAVADYDGDGDMDIAASEEFSDLIVYYENLGGAVFAAEVILTTGLNGLFDLHAADVTGDGLPDICFAAFYAQKVGYIPATPSGFGARVDIPGSLFGPYSIRTWDPDGDGDLDLAVPIYSESRTVVFPNAGGGSFSGKNTLFAAFEYHSIAEPFDTDGDGDEDLLIGFRNTVTYLENLRISGGCSAASAPTGLVASVSGSALLQWNPIPGSVACQVQGRQLPGTSYATLSPIFGSEPDQASVPGGALVPGASYAWRVRCACSISPLNATPFSLEDTFSVPVVREQPSAEGQSLYPNPASDRIWLNDMSDQEIMELVDGQGRVVLQGLPGARDLDVTGVPAGLYHARLIRPSGEARDLGAVMIVP